MYTEFMLKITSCIYIPIAWCYLVYYSFLAKNLAWPWPDRQDRFQRSWTGNVRKDKCSVYLIYKIGPDNKHTKPVINGA